jgi:dimethylhistidine N-methyltransferase
MITELPEYYLTRTELSLLSMIAPAVALAMRPGSTLVEYGASHEGKAEFLLRERDRTGAPVFRHYVPIDIAADALEQLRARVAESHPDLLVHPVARDFQQPVRLPECDGGLDRLGFFPGSTIGNLEPEAVRRFLIQARATLGSAALFLIGFDLRKDPALLLPAYDDAAGVTAAFNRNILSHLNKVAGTDFDIHAFEHRAVWNERESRMEMHLVSTRDQVISVGDTRIGFCAGESIHTENSYKHSRQEFGEMAAEAGWNVRQEWTDDASLFALFLLKPNA